jgi:SAM-dependent methyltransferase
MSSSGWISFWDNERSILADARHKTAHYKRLAEDLRRFAPPGGVMLDYGCGEALFAARVAEPTARLILCEAAPNVRAMLAGRFGGNRKIVLRRPEDVAAMSPQSLDVIVMHSVAQYLGADEFDALIKLFRRLLKPDGLLVLGDIVPPKLSALDDASELLKFAAREGFYKAALSGLVKAYFSRYWRLRKSLGIARYGESALIAKLDAAGFTATRARTNIGHNNARMTFLAHAR